MSTPVKTSLLEQGVTIRLDVARIQGHTLYIPHRVGNFWLGVSALRVPVVRFHAKPKFSGRSWLAYQYDVNRILSRRYVWPDLQSFFRSCPWFDIGDVCNFFMDNGMPPKDVTVWEFIKAAEEYIQRENQTRHAAEQLDAERPQVEHEQARFDHSKAKRLAKLDAWRCRRGGGAS